MKSCFPSFECLPAMPQASDRCEAPFQPLNCPPATDPHAGTADREGERTPDQLMEEARARGFQNGLCAGKSEAVRLAEATLRPVLKTFAHTLQRSSGAIRALAREASGQIVQGAFEIAGRILCSKVVFGHGQMRDMQSALADRLSTAYRFAIAMHPDDLARLEQLIAAGAIEWSGQTAIQIQGDERLAQGEIEAVNEDAPQEALEHHLLALFDDWIQRASTK